MTGLLALLSPPSDADVEVLLISLQALLFLTANPANREPLTLQSSMLLRLTALAEHDDSRVRAMVQQTLDHLQAVVNRDKRGTHTRGEGGGGVDRGASGAGAGGSGCAGGRLRMAGASAAAVRYLHSVPLQVERVSADGCVGPAQLSGEERARVERALIVQRSVISVSVSRAGAVTLYTKQDTQQLIDTAQLALHSIDPALTIRLPGTAQGAADRGHMDKENDRPHTALTASTTSSTSKPSAAASAASTSSSSSPLSPSTTASSVTGSSTSSSFSTSVCSSSSSPSLASSSRALVAHSSLEGNSLQGRFQAKAKKAVEAEQKQSLVKGLFSSVHSFFW